MSLVTNPTKFKTTDFSLSLFAVSDRCSSLFVSFDFNSSLFVWRNVGISGLWDSLWKSQGGIVVNGAPRESSPWSPMGFLAEGLAKGGLQYTLKGPPEGLH